MPIAKILAVMTGGVRDAAVLGHAIAAARPFHAHVVALFVRPDLAEAIAFFNDGVSGVVVDEVIQASRDAADEAERRIEASVASVCTQAGVPVVPAPVRSEGVTLSIRQVQGILADQLTEAARLSDLVVFGPLHEGEKAGFADAFIQVLTDTDRPALLATETVPAPFAGRVAIGWDGKSAAAQAVSAAIPYLQRAEHVAVLAVQRSASNPPATAPLHEYLELHGIVAHEQIIPRGSRSTGEVLLESAEAARADLLVVGG
jgi:hypothetical protein